MVRPSAVAVSAQPEPQTAFRRSPADIGRGRGSPRGMGTLGRTARTFVPTEERQSLVTEAYLARNREFESTSLQRRVHVSRDFALPRREAGFSRGCTGPAGVARSAETGIARCMAST